MNHVIARSGCLVALLFVVSASPAVADGSVSVFANPEFVMQSDGEGTAILTQVGIGVDLGPKRSVPLRVRLDLSDAFGSGEPYGSDNIISGGASVRLTTPLYAGAGFTVDGVNLPALCCFSEPANVLAEGELYIAPPQSKVGFGSNFFAGQKIVSKPGFGLAVEASYRFLPNINSTNYAAFGIGLRASFL
jgi:hypothetical protein